jgi:hypothetical protein
MLHTRDKDGQPPSTLHLNFDSPSAGSGLSLAISITADNSAVLFVRNTRVGSTLGIFGPDSPAAPPLLPVSGPPPAAESPASSTLTLTATAPAAAAVGETASSGEGIAEVPEPSSLLLLGTGLFTVALWQWRKTI